MEEQKVSLIVEEKVEVEEEKVILDTKITDDYKQLLDEYKKLKSIIESLESKMINHEHYKLIYKCCICNGN